MCAGVEKWGGGVAVRKVVWAAKLGKRRTSQIFFLQESIRQPGREIAADSLQIKKRKIIK